MLWSLALAAPKVVGGFDAAEGDWPDTVALFRGEEFVCTGTLIAPSWVLSAGHCVNLVDRVVLDTIDRSEGLERTVVRQIEHPDFNSTYDVGLFELHAPVTTVAPRALALDCLAELVLPESAATLVGWGFTDSNASEPTLLLQQLDLPIVDPLCSDLDRGCRSSVSPGGELVAGGDGLDSCTGDSGGPMFVDTPRGEVLAATVARAALPSFSLCGSGGIYVRVDAVAEWIESTIGSTLERPDCTGVNRPPQPVAEPLALVQGASVPVVLELGDPDTSDAHTVELVTAPERGNYADGFFTAEPFQIGTDSFILRVTDDGFPPLSNLVTVPVQVFPAGHLPHDAPPAKGRGCSAVRGSFWLGLALLCCTRARRPGLRPEDPRDR